MAKPSGYFTAALRDLSDALDPLGIRWAVAGAVAANQYRDQIRTTTDLDVLLSLTEQGVDVVVQALHQQGWHSVDVIGESLLRAQHPVGGRLDVLVSGTEYEKGAIERAPQVDLDESRTYRFLAIEDVMILKLIADRYRDNDDVESILVTRPDLDWEYMSIWLKEFDLESRLRRIEKVAISSGRMTGELSRKRE